MNNIIKENREYIQNKKIYIRQSYFDNLNKLVKNNNIVIIEWQRRVWKSSLVLSYIKWNDIDLNKVFYINKELDIIDNIKEVSDLKNIFLEFIDVFWDPEYIIIDEVQDINNWEKFIRKYQALWKYKIILTWSNSKLLSWELATYLTGRYLSLEVFAFSYKEFLDFKKTSTSDEIFLEYIEFGWMPEILFIEDKETKKNYLKNVLSNILLKDVVARYNIRDIKLLEKILAFLSQNTGSLVSITSIWNYLSLQFKKEYSTKTIANYLKYLEIPYLINEAQRYDIKWKKILEYVSKYYFTDTWISNIFWFTFATDIWKVLENLVYLKLRQDWYKVFVWENNSYEIDFVWEKNWEKIYIQVCYLLSSENTIKIEFSNLEKIKDNYKKIVVSMDKTFWNTYNGIENINIIEFLVGSY